MVKRVWPAARIFGVSAWVLQTCMHHKSHMNAMKNNAHSLPRISMSTSYQKSPSTRFEACHKRHNYLSISYPLSPLRDPENRRSNNRRMSIFLLIKCHHNTNEMTAQPQQLTSYAASQKLQHVNFGTVANVASHSGKLTSYKVSVRLVPL